MERISNFVINFKGGGLRIPVGYRFCPTDEEVVEHYLKKKVFGLPLPVSVIPEYDVFLTDPWGIPGDLKEKRFFFSKRKSLLRRSVGSGSGSGIWKPIGREKLILKHQGMNNQVIGLRKSLIFSERIAKGTRWVMHEYRLPYSATNPNSTQQIEMGDWAVYCLFQKRRRPKRQGVVVQPSVVEEEEEEDGREFPQPPRSSCSSGVTEVSSNGTENTDQEESSSGLGFSSYPQAHVRGV